MEAELRGNLQALTDAYVAATGLNETTVCQRAFGDWQFFKRLSDSERASFTVRKYDAAVGWFAVNWPKDAAWPEKVERPPGQGAAA